MHLLRSLYDIRGVCAEKENLTLAKGGDISRSSFNRKSLLEIQEDNADAKRLLQELFDDQGRHHRSSCGELRRLAHHHLFS